jgi:murein DD-endopeptidase MepM/ murein hydrolase activator NlpD
MHTRKLLIGLVVAGLLAAGFGNTILPAGAEEQTVYVTLVTGETVPVTVTAPSGTPVDQIPVPTTSTPIVSVSTTPPPSSTQGTGSTTNPPVSTQQSTPSAPATAEPQGGQQEQQSTQETKTPKPQGEGPTKTLVDDSVKKVNEQVAKDRTPQGVPTTTNPTLSVAVPGPAPIGVPNFFIEKFRIPPFLLPIYQAAGIEYGVRWEVLAAINEIETDYGRNLNVSSAGALGWMQFMPSTWKRYGVDANHDGVKDPYNPVDAIFAAARYLKAAGAAADISRAVFAYNHADWYVQSVLMRARLIGGLPADLVGSLTGLTQGHFPVHAKARYADDISEAEATARVAKGHNAAIPVDGSSTRRGIKIFAKAGSPVIATQDGQIVGLGATKRLGRYIKLRDVYGNTYTYGHLKSVAQAYPVPKPKTVSKAAVDEELKLPHNDPTPTQAASAGTQPRRKAVSSPKPNSTRTGGRAGVSQTTPKVTVAKERLFANPKRPEAYRNGGQEQILNSGAGFASYKNYFTEVFGLNRDDVTLKPLKKGSKVIAGTILGRIGRTSPTLAPHVLFEIRPAGRGAPRIDPKPILDGWKLLESTAIYRAAGKNPFFGSDAKDPTVGQILLMSKEALVRRVLTDPRVQIYDCGRRDITSGQIDRRVLATLEFLSASGLKPTVSALKCGHSLYTTSGNISEHSSGDAVDIAAINGIPIVGHQGPGSITDITIRRLLTLQGTMKPHQIISLMTFDGADNTLALPDHYDHIHVGFRPLYGTNSKLGKQLGSVLKPSQWIKLISRIGTIDNPTVLTQPSKYAIRVATPKRASTAHVGE